MTTVVVQNLLTDPAGQPIKNANVIISLTSGPTGGFIGSTQEILSVTYATTDHTGLWTANLTPNSSITPDGTYYVVRQLHETLAFVVPASVGPFWLRDILVQSPTMPAGVVVPWDLAYVDNGDGTITLTTGTSAAAIGADAAGVSATETTRAQTAEGLAAQKASNLSDLASAPTARTNLGLGTAATHPATDFDAAGAAAAVTTTSIGAATTGALATEANTARANEANAGFLTTGTVADPRLPSRLAASTVTSVDNGDGTITLTLAV